MSLPLINNLYFTHLSAAKYKCKTHIYFIEEKVYDNIKLLNAGLTTIILS